MTNPRDVLAQRVAEAAERFALDPADLEARVRRQLARRTERGRLPYKQCSACGDLLPALAFAEDSAAGDGLQRTCRACNAARLAARRSATPDPGTLTR